MKGNRVFFLLLALGAALAVFGAAQGQPSHVMAKAVRVCLECVGIG